MLYRYAIHAFCGRFTTETEGVGFEPTVGFPTLDFESSALNRTQPPFLKKEKERRTLNVQHPTSNANAFENWMFRAAEPRAFVVTRFPQAEFCA
jgi:hypothetical protein